MAERLMSPTGGFLLQGRGGATGNFEVVFAWPDGGLVHFFRDNDKAGLPWRGPGAFGMGRYQGATVIESDFKSHDRTMGNLEVLATAANGEVHHYFRDNGGAYTWHGPFKVSEGAAHAPSMAYTGKRNVGSTVGTTGSAFWAAIPNAGTGFQYRERRNAPGGYIAWYQHGGAGIEHFQGLALTLTTIGATSPYSSYREAGLGAQIVAAVCRTGYVHLYMEGLVRGGTARDWYSSAIIGGDLFRSLSNAFQGRPSLIQGSFGQEDPGLFDFGHYGNLELVVPHRGGGFMHFYRLCGIPMHNIEPISWGWGGPFHVTGPQYSEVSLIQSTFSSHRHGNLEVVARHRDQRGFDFYWRDATWHGPFRIGT